MKNKISNLKLFFIFLFLLALTIIVKVYFLPKNFSSIGELQAEKLAIDWIKVIDNVKKEKGINNKKWQTIKYGALLGTEFSNITTTLGSLEAKQTALNPKFSSLIYRWLKEKHIDSAQTVGITISGSFPSLTIFALAAVKTIGAKAILISSLGSSMYGANEPEATWIDYETWLRKRAWIAFFSSIITLGGENDAGLGLLEEGIIELEKAAERNSVQLYMPTSLEESINTKTKFLLESKIGLIINIGGNQAAIGSCSHSSVLPNGLWKNYSTCSHNNRGIISRIYGQGIPVIHLLNIRDLAVKNGLPVGITN